MSYTAKGQWRIEKTGITSKIMAGNYRVAEHIYNKANAYLIVAAPAMYEALELLIQAHKSNSVSNVIIAMRQAEQALAQVKGKE